MPAQRKSLIGAATSKVLAVPDKLPPIANDSDHYVKKKKKEEEESDHYVSLSSSDDSRGCNACSRLENGSITQFMTTEKLLDKYPERIEGFNLYDYENEGFILAENLGKALSAVGYLPTATDLETVCQHLHISRGSHVDFRLFVSVLAHQMMTCSDHQILDAFRIFDKEGRGTIDSKELKHIMTVLGVHTDEDQVDDMIREVDVDGDGDIDFEEFVMMIKK